MRSFTVRRAASASAGVLCVCLFVFIALPTHGTGCSREENESVRLANEGYQAFRSKSDTLAKRRFREALSLNPDNVQAHFGLGLVEFRRKEYESAKRHLRKAVDLDSSLHEAALQIGLIAMKTKDWDEAEAAFKELISKDSNNALAHYHLAGIYERKGALDDANSNFRKSIRLAPHSPAGYVSLANLYVKVGAQSEALAVLKEGARIIRHTKVSNQQNLAVLYSDLGVLLLEQGDSAGAVDALLKALDIGAPLGVAFNLGCAYINNGQPKEAIHYFQQVSVGETENAAMVTVANEMVDHLRDRLKKAKGKATASKTDG